ncbi:MAG: radical SAM protein [Patescibacteria group bacterium]|nr:radical SAM protein [Patescibacteria group bacterium]
MKCNICYAGTTSYDSRGCPKLKEISKNFFKKQLTKIKNKGMAIRLLGGEPTLRKDLPELIRLVKESGNVADLATNGIKIADDINYLKILKESGLKSVYIWIDSLKNKNISTKMRGGNFISHKLRALQNLKKLQISTNIIQVIIKNLNEGEVRDVLELARRNKFVSRIRIHGYKHMGKAYFSQNQEFLSDELTEVIARRLPEIFTLKEIYCFQRLVYALNAIKGVPVCHLNYNFIVPRKGNLKVFDFEKLPGILDEFKKIWLKNKRAAGNFLFKSLRLMMAKYFPILENNFRNQFFADNFLEVLIGCSATVFNFDEKLTNQQCFATSLNLGPERDISRCEENIRLHSVVSGNNTNQCETD